MRAESARGTCCPVRWQGFVAALANSRFLTGGAGPAFPSRRLRSRAREVKIPALSPHRTEGQGRGTLVDDPVWFANFRIKIKVRVGAGHPFLSTIPRISRCIFYVEVKIPALSLHRTEGQGRGTPAQSREHAFRLSDSKSGGATLACSLREGGTRQLPTCRPNLCIAIHPQRTAGSSPGFQPDSK